MHTRRIGALVAIGALGGASVLALRPAAATPTVVGGCTGLRGIVSAKSTFIWPGDGQPAGMTDKNHDITMSTKGINNTSGNLGTCSWTGPGATGTRTISKWSSKLTSPATDCIGDGGAGEYPPNGKSSYAFTDGSKVDAYVASGGGGSAENPDFTYTQGIVTKGLGVGASITSEIWIAAASKDKTQTADYAGVPGLDLSIITTAPAAPGYRFDLPALTSLQGCLATTEPVTEQTNIRTFVVGSGPSELLGVGATNNYGGTTDTDPAAGVTLTFGL